MDQGWSSGHWKCQEVGINGGCPNRYWDSLITKGKNRERREHYRGNKTYSMMEKSQTESSQLNR
jgi:hypothetical protein